MIIVMIYFVTEADFGHHTLDTTSWKVQTWWTGEGRKQSYTSTIMIAVNRGIKNVLISPFELI